MELRWIHLFSLLTLLAASTSWQANLCEEVDTDYVKEVDFWQRVIDNTERLVATGKPRHNFRHKRKISCEDVCENICADMLGIGWFAISGCKSQQYPRQYTTYTDRAPCGGKRYIKCARCMRPSSCKINEWFDPSCTVKSHDPKAQKKGCCRAYPARGTTTTFTMASDPQLYSSACTATTPGGCAECNWHDMSLGYTDARMAAWNDDPCRCTFNVDRDVLFGPDYTAVIINTTTYTAAQVRAAHIAADCRAREKHNEGGRKFTSREHLHFIKSVAQLENANAIIINGDITVGGCLSTPLGIGGDMEGVNDFEDFMNDVPQDVFWHFGNHDVELKHPKYSRGREDCIINKLRRWSWKQADQGKISSMDILGYKLGGTKFHTGLGYSFDREGIRFFMLGNLPWFTRDEGEWFITSKVDWLKEELEIACKHKVVGIALLWHIPWYSGNDSGKVRRRPNDAFLDMLTNHNTENPGCPVFMTSHGHFHHHNRYEGNVENRDAGGATTDIPSFVTGGGAYFTLQSMIIDWDNFSYRIARHARGAVTQFAGGANQFFCIHQDPVSGLFGPHASAASCSRPPSTQRLHKNQAIRAIWQKSQAGVDLAYGEWDGYDSTTLDQCKFKADIEGVSYFAWTAQVHGGYCKVLKPDVATPNLGTNQGYGYKLWEKKKYQSPSGSIFRKASDHCIHEVLQIDSVFGTTAHSIHVKLDMPVYSGHRQWILNLGQESTGANHWIWNGGSIQFGTWGGHQIRSVDINACTDLTTTFDGINTLSLYCNGGLVGHIDNANLNIQNFNLAVAGNQNYEVPQGNFAGCITHVEVWDYALRSDEVASLSMIDTKPVFGLKASDWGGTASGEAWVDFVGKKKSTVGSGADIEVRKFNGLSAAHLSTDQDYLEWDIDIGPNSMPQMSLELLVWVPSIENNRGWVFGDENGGCDRYILLHDDRVGGISASCKYSSGVGQVPTGEWVHIISTYDQSTQTSHVYKNGARASTTGTSVSHDSGRQKLRLGSPWGGHFANAWVAEAYVYEFVVDKDLAEDLYHSAVKPDSCTWTVAGFVQQAHLNGPYSLREDKINDEISYSENGAQSILGQGHNGYWWFDDDLADFSLEDQIQGDGVWAYFWPSKITDFYHGEPINAMEWDSGTHTWVPVGITVTKSCDGDSPDPVHYTELVGPCRTANGGMGSFTKVTVSTSEECQKKCDESTSCIGYETHETVQTHCELHSQGTTTSDPSSTAGTCFLKDSRRQLSEQASRLLRL